MGAFSYERGTPVHACSKIRHWSAGWSIVLRRAQGRERELVKAAGTRYWLIGVGLIHLLITVYVPRTHGLARLQRCRAGLVLGGRSSRIDAAASPRAPGQSSRTSWLSARRATSRVSWVSGFFLERTRNRSSLLKVLGGCSGRWRSRRAPGQEEVGVCSAQIAS